MKKHYLLWIFLFITYLPSFAQVGFLGKRTHFQFESKFTPAWSNLNFNYKQGFCFNYHLMPSVEYVLADRWSISANYQFFETAFKIQEPDYHFDYPEPGYYEKNKRYQGYQNGFLKSNGIGINALYYFKDIAPAGYYIKMGVDAFFYNISVPYQGYDTLITTLVVSYYPVEEIEYHYINRPGIFTARDWAIGVHLEFGRNFFVGRYVSMGASLSCGLLCKGWGKLITNDNPHFIDAANKRLLTSYIGGISIKIGILPF